jgi:hypothetical protein
MHLRTRFITSLVSACAVAAAGLAAFGGSAITWAEQDPYPPAATSVATTTNQADDQAGPNSVVLRLTPASPQFGQCLPDADVRLAVELSTDRRGFDQLHIRAQHVAPKRDYTVFLLEQAGSPFGAAEYIGDFSTDDLGNGFNTFDLIVQEAFSSTIVDGKRVRVELNRVGMWFADPRDDEFCVPGSAATPFDGDDEAGVQAFNSANADPLPAP